MKARVMTRLYALEERIVAPAAPPAVDYSLLTVPELERLAAYGHRFEAWAGEDWLQAGVTSEERQDVDALLAKASGLSD